MTQLNHFVALPNQVKSQNGIIVNTENQLLLRIGSAKQSFD